MTKSFPWSSVPGYRLGCVVVGMMVLQFVAGCELSNAIPNFSNRTMNLLGKKKSNELPKIAAPYGSIQVEIVFIERPIGDPLTKGILWEEVDQVGALSSDVRKQLEINGFRVGHVSSSPPRALQKLLGLTAEFGDATEASGTKRLSGRRVWLRPSTSVEVQTSKYYDECAINYHYSPGDRGSTKDYTNARCVFRVKAERLQDGWANVEFTPEIHSGSQQMRHLATDSGWEMKSSQNIEPLFDQKFSVALNVGEMAVISAEPLLENSVGKHFFLSAADEPQVQRLLIVRLAEMQSTDPIFED